MSLQEIVDEVNKYPLASLLVLTGGEPSLFIDEAFVAELKQKTNKTIVVETNGTRPLPNNLDWVTLSPKYAFEGGDLEPCVLTHCASKSSIVSSNSSILLSCCFFVFS